MAAALSSRRAVPDTDACVSDLVVRVDEGGDDAADETEAAGGGAGVEAPPQLWVRRAAVWDAPAELRVVGVLSHYAAARRKQLEQREKVVVVIPTLEAKVVALTTGKTLMFRAKQST